MNPHTHQWPISFRLSMNPSGAIYNTTGENIHWYPEGTLLRQGKFCFASGGFADVWKADLREETVAVKVWRGPSFDAKTHRAFTKRLTKELDVWRRLRHPNIVMFKGIASDFGHLPALVLPFYRNGTVMQYIRSTAMPDVLSLVLDIASALSYLHSSTPPVVHGDLKGSNILVDDDGRACICDFGLSQIVGETNFTTANIAGSCRWMPPEVMSPKDSSDLEGGIFTTTQGDVYSFGMTMLEMYSGRAPFSHRRTESAVIFDVIRGGRPHRPTLAESPQLTDGVWDLIASCWTEDPDHRPNMRAVGFWLQSITMTEGGKHS